MKKFVTVICAEPQEKEDWGCAMFKSSEVAQSIMNYNQLLQERAMLKAQHDVWCDKSKIKYLLKQTQASFKAKLDNIEYAIKQVDKTTIKMVDKLNKTKSGKSPLSIDIRAAEGKKCPFCGKQFITLMDRAGSMDPRGAPLFISRPGNKNDGLFIHPGCYTNALQTYLANYSLYSTQDSDGKNYGLFYELYNTFKEINQ